MYTSNFAAKNMNETINGRKIYLVIFALFKLKK